MKDSSFYLIANIAVKLMSILVIPVLTRSFSIEDFAIFDLFLVLNNFLVTMMTLGMESGIALLLAESQDDKTPLSFLFVFSLVSGLIATMLIWSLFI
ncbi:MAG: oligosaccharide flippase family protein, partial [Pseudomonadota bacterium]